jgi:hypothetical protein
MGISIMRSTIDAKGPPPEFGWLFVAMGLLFLVGALAYAASLVVAGRSLAREKHWTYCLVVAGLSCAFFPFGTILGVFTIVVLSKSEVKALFEAPPPPTA